MALGIDLHRIDDGFMQYALFSPQLRCLRSPDSQKCWSFLWQIGQTPRQGEESTWPASVVLQSHGKVEVDDLKR
ncbi:hypothetical protein N7457_006236 [Penicillium paradoxum]|uniref:uncharacterized protein n=1 Tax=Penicillium paradoxum TaxID=176176 RepID=UPI0025472E48|nr:uncharacterized protein N7457_006236 [Penicillium paradoxum]KAJ5781076.1 hypothetical protein N7457_006236 [Penicillium paradoxum]